VPGFGEATFVQAVGFLKITGGVEPLDSTWIHPESYEVAGKVLERLGGSREDLAGRQQAESLAERAAALDLDTVSAELGIGRLLLADIVEQLARPGRDPREDLPRPFFKKGVLKLEDLQPGMELLGSVLNVVDFGAFVDIGLHDSGLVHISHLSNQYVRDPHDVVSVGQVVRVWVLEIDKGRRRVALTMIEPGTARQQERSPQREGQAGSQGEGRSRNRGQGRPSNRSEGRPPRPPRVAAAGGEVAAGASGVPPRTDRPAGGGRRGTRGRPPQREQGPRVYVANAEKVAKPLTKKMKEGKEPLRTFGDLKQFFTTRDESSADGPEAGGEAPA
jgi:uncharacterized protein